MKANVKVLVEELANVIHHSLDKRIASKSIDKVTKNSLKKIAKKVIDEERKEIKDTKKGVRKEEIKAKKLEKRGGLKQRQSSTKKVNDDHKTAIDGKSIKSVPASQSVK